MTKHFRARTLFESKPRNQGKRGFPSGSSGLPGLMSPRPSVRNLPPALCALTRAVRAKDPYTGRHCDRVSVLAVLIADRLGMDRALRDDIALGGLLHDVGKIGVPEPLLRKEGRLTLDECRRVQQHPVIGESILRPLLAELPVVAAIVRSHHERVDGRGYPDGLRADDIPLPARIVAVADAFDAMTSSRSYRRALPLTVALQELIANINTQFDEQCVSALLSIMQDACARARCGSPSHLSDRVVLSRRSGRSFSHSLLPSAPPRHRRTLRPALLNYPSVFT